MCSLPCALSAAWAEGLGGGHRWKVPSPMCTLSPGHHPPGSENPAALYCSSKITVSTSFLNHNSHKNAIYHIASEHSCHGKSWIFWLDFFPPSSKAFGHAVMRKQPKAEKPKTFFSMTLSSREIINECISGIAVRYLSLWIWIRLLVRTYMMKFFWLSFIDWHVIRQHVCD